MSPEDPVADDEWLFRSIGSDPPQFIESDGKFLVTYDAFADSAREPSVDRASLCDNDPTFTQRTDSDVVIAIKAVNVRSAESYKGDLEGPPEQLTRYEVDVHADPICADNEDGLDENLAHALVIADPEISKNQRKPFKRLRESLANIANEHGEWRISPSL